MPQNLRTDADGKRVTVPCLVSDLVFAWQLEPLEDGTRIAVHVEIPEAEAFRLDDQRAASALCLARRARQPLATADLQHEVERRLGRAPHRVKPPSLSTAVRRCCPAWAPSASPTSWLSDAGVQSIVEPA